MHAQTVFTFAMVNYCLIGCLDLTLSAVCTIIYIGAFIYANNILYINPLGDILEWTIPLAINVLISMVLTQIVLCKFFDMKMRELHLETGHEEFVDNLEEGLIIKVNATQEIKLFNRAARLMLQL